MLVLIRVPRLVGNSGAEAPFRPDLTALFADSTGVKSFGVV